MKLIRSTLAATAALILATGCSQEAEAPANQQETADANTMMADPANPYAQAEMQMMQRMEAAQGANPSETWTRKMIEHHRGAIAMNDIVLAQGGDPQVLEKARMTTEMQRKEIAELEGLLPAGSGQTPPAGGANPYAEAISEMNQQMMAAMGENPSETWLEKMIIHHRGGAEMSNVLLELGGDPRVVEKARMTAQKQLQEASELQRMLSGDMPAAAASSQAPATGTEPAPAPAPAPPKAQPAPRAKAETPKAATKAPEQPAADPHAGHDMGNMSNMSH
jgi:uncharacterized protein (DUF305 family)